MKVLFVASGNAKHQDISPFIASQAASLQALGIDISFFPVRGKGAAHYYRNSRRLQEHLRANPVDLIHAHYTLSGWVAVLGAGRTPVVLSLMGSDAYGEYVGYRKVLLRSRYLTVLTWLIQPFVKGLISKSANIEKFVYRKKISHIVPNGVRLEQFKLYPGGCREELGLAPDKKYVLFIGDPRNTRKNYRLAEAAVQRLGRPDVELIAPFPVPHDTVVKYFNSVDAFAMCSFMEGSPNVVKEAMACNCPMVVTPAGDAAWVVGDTPGCYVASYDSEDYARQLARALEYAEKNGRTAGRDRLLALGLDAPAVAERIAGIYRQVVGQPEPAPVES